MSNLQLSLRAVLPLFLMMCCGYLLKRSGQIGPKGFDQINTLNFKLAFPATLIRSMYSCDLSRTNLTLSLFNAALILGLFFLYVFSLPKVEQDKRREAVMIQGLLRGNATIYGLALAQALLDPENLGTVMLTFATTVPLLNVISVFVLSTCGEKQTNPGQVVLKIVKNPFIVSIFLGLALNALKIPIGETLWTVIDDVGGIATPLAFICLGGAFDFRVIASNKRALLSVSFLRLLAVPAIVLPLASWLGYRGPEMLSVLCVFATPTAVASFPLAKSLGGDAELAAGIVLSTTILSVVTLFVWISMLLSAHLI